MIYIVFIGYYVSIRFGIGLENAFQSLDDFFDLADATLLIEVMIRMYHYQRLRVLEAKMPLRPEGPENLRPR